MNEEFYIGWQEKAPDSYGRATRRIVLFALDSRSWLGQYL